MKLVRYDETMLDECSEFWWELYKDRPYVVRPDGYQDINNPTVGNKLFGQNLNAGLFKLFDNIFLNLLLIQVCFLYILRTNHINSHYVSISERGLSGI